VSAGQFDDRSPEVIGEPLCYLESPVAAGARIPIRRTGRYETRNAKRLKLLGAGFVGNEGCDFDFLETGFGAPVGEPVIY